MGKKRFTVEEIQKSLIKNRGFTTYTANDLGCALSTLERYIKESPGLEETLREARESRIDFAEGKLLSNMKDGDTTALIFFLKTIGKKRGYNEKPDDNPNDLNAIIELIKALKSATE